MKRDMDLVRSILLEFEEKDAYTATDTTTAGHVAIMKDAGLIDAMIPTPVHPSTADIIRLTWRGHDFIDNARKPEIWEKAKETLKDKALSVSFDILIELLKRLASAHLGIPT